MNTFKLITISVFAVVFTAACSKSKEGSAATAPVTYYKSNGSCYDAKTNAKVAETNCSNVSYYLQNNTCYTAAHSYIDISNCHALVGQYYYVGTSCYDKTVRNWVTPTYCTTSSGTTRYQWQNGSTCIDTHMNNTPVHSSYCLNPGGTGGEQCVESNRYLYFDTYRGQWYSMNCSVSNCAGLSLWDQRAGKQVTCAY